MISHRLVRRELARVHKVCPNAEWLMEKAIDQFLEESNIVAVGVSIKAHRLSAARVILLKIDGGWSSWLKSAPNAFVC